MEVDHRGYISYQRRGHHVFMVSPICRRLLDAPEGRGLTPRRMQHVLQISRKIDYALRAMIHLAGLPEGRIASLQDLASTLHLPREFLAKILKILTAKGLIRSSRGAH